MAKGTEDMPQPTLVDYERQFELTEKFKEDVHTILDNMPYAEVFDIIAGVDQNTTLPIAFLNEIVQRISRMPYQVVKDFIQVINTNQSLYFKLIEPEPPKEEEKK